MNIFMPDYPIESKSEELEGLIKEFVEFYKGLLLQNTECGKLVFEEFEFSDIDTINSSKFAMSRDFKYKYSPSRHMLHFQKT